LWLIGSGAGPEKVAQPVEGATEFASRSWELEPAHRAVAAFDAAMVLFEPIVQKDVNRRRVLAPIGTTTP
jgi:hypothetical protein